MVGWCITKTETAPWWRQAQADLDTAAVLFQTGRFYATSWFVQQAVEKGLKALYIERRGVLAPRTHDLQFLATEVSTPSDLAQDVGLLNPTFDLTRYPDAVQATAPVDLVTEERAGRHLEAARRIFAWLDTQLGGTSTRP